MVGCCVVDDDDDVSIRIGLLNEEMIREASEGGSGGSGGGSCGSLSVARRVGDDFVEAIEMFETFADAMLVGVVAAVVVVVVCCCVFGLLCRGELNWMRCGEVADEVMPAFESSSADMTSRSGTFDELLLALAPLLALRASFNLRKCEKLIAVYCRERIAA
jgi:hypothetical protein